MRQHLIELVLFSTYAELRAERARSYLGLAWWVLDPAMMMLTFWLVFDVIMHSGGPEYLPSLLIGLTLWQWMKSCMTHGGHAIWSNLALVRQVVSHGDSVVFISHDIDEVREITDRATILRDGAVSGAISTRF